MKDLAKRSAAHRDSMPKLVHYSRNKFDTLRPLTYEELLKDRAQGR